MLVYNIDRFYHQPYMDNFDTRLFDINIENIDSIENYGIINFDKYIFNLFLDSKYVSNFRYDYTEHDILINTDLAIYLYSRGQHIDLCLSRFLGVDLERASELIKDDTFFTFFSTHLE